MYHWDDARPVIRAYYGFVLDVMCEVRRKVFGWHGCCAFVYVAWKNEHANERANG